MPQVSSNTCLPAVASPFGAAAACAAPAPNRKAAETRPAAMPDAFVKPATLFLALRGSPRGRDVADVRGEVKAHLWMRHQLFRRPRRAGPGFLPERAAVPRPGRRGARSPSS